MNIYDFDGTLYDGDSTVDFFLFCLKRKPSLVRFLPEQAWGFLLHGLKRIDRTRLKEYFFSFLKGVDGEAMLEPFWAGHRHKIFSWYPERHREDDLVISASPEFLLAPICGELGVGGLIASRVNVRTGRFEGPNCKGEEKVRRLRARYDRAEVEEFYSDSKADLPLAQLATRAFLVEGGTIKNWEWNEV